MKTRASQEHWQTSDVLVCCARRNGSLLGDRADLSMIMPHSVTSMSAPYNCEQGEFQNMAVSHLLQVDSEKHEEGNARHTSKPWKG